MKKQLLVLLLFVSAAFYAQDKTENIAVTEKAIAKKWVFKDIVNDKLSKQEYAENKDLMEGIFLELRADKTCMTSFILDEEGTWSLDAATNIITVKDRKTNIWKINWLKENQISLSRNKAAQQIIFEAK